VTLGIVLAALLAHAAPAHAYIGPGAGFALLSSFFVVLTTIVLALASLLRWPFRLLWRLIRGRGGRRKPSIGRLIIVGFDGQEPTLTDEWLKAGKLPHFAALAAKGCYHRLRTTYPPVSPVAWSCFTTGTNPGRHNIFDFLDRDPRTYLPRLSSTRIGKVERVLTLGRYRLPLRKPELRLLRRSQPFWTLLGEARIWSTVLRVPITFPPDRFYGAQLSAMAAPDLLGTQGTFFLYTTRPAGERFKEGGIRVGLTFAAAGGDAGAGAGARAGAGGRDWAETRITGPENPFDAKGAALELPMRLTRDRAARTVTIDVSGRRVTLAVGALSDWVPLAFRAAPFVKVHGLCRLQVTELDEHVSLYVSPISLDPERPAMPVSHPSYYATYLAKKIGPYSTLGLAEDTWALNEGVIDDATFLKQTWDIDDERQRMFFAGLDRLREGALVCVFDATDRVQHMFWRGIDPTHPANRARKPGAGANASAGAPAVATEDAPASTAIAEQYRRNDAFLGQVMAKLKDDDLLMVLSDHGFNAFRRGVNLNRWLLDHGYLALKPGGDASAEWLRDVDWSRTRAYALGLTGIFLNIKGRERDGIVSPGAEARQLKAELMASLGGLRDAEAGADTGVAVGAGAIGIREIFDASVVYDGPYVENAPDLLVGYNTGYRVSWDCATGMVSGPVFEDNVKPWSGDHCIDPRLVPGVFFCSRAVTRDDPALIDIAPTALELFGVDVPKHMEGASLFKEPPPHPPSPPTPPQQTPVRGSRGESERLSPVRKDKSRRGAR
jgi:predicted AlkP superfamily phosphohydrolase/phosphomutase